MYCPELPLAEQGPPHPDADEAEALVAAFYRDATGLDLEFNVYWSFNKIPVGLGRTLRGGAASSCINLWVWDGNGTKPVSELSLAHEMAHCWAGDVPPECDAEYDIVNDHADPFWWGNGGMVDQANALLAENGL